MKTALRKAGLCAPRAAPGRQLGLQKWDLMLQHDVTPVVRLVLSIAPTRWRLHRVGGLCVGGHVKRRFVACAKKPAYFV